MTKPESLVVKVLVRTYILTIQTQVFLFKSNYGTAVTIRSLFSRIHAYNIKLIMQYCSFIHVQHSSSLHTLLLFSTSRIHSSIDTVISSLLSIECWEILDRHVITEISIHFCLLIIAIRNSVTYLSNCIK